MCGPSDGNRPVWYFTAVRCTEMVRHLFLSGAKGVGKSTLVRGLLSCETGRVGGFFTVKHNGCVYLLRPGTEDIPTEKTRLFRCGETAEPDRFETLGCAALSDTVGCTLLVMDELGPHETAAHGFQTAVLKALSADVPVIGVLQQAESPFLAQIATHHRVTVLTVTEENRSALPQALLRWRREQSPDKQAER